MEEWVPPVYAVEPLHCRCVRSRPWEVLLGILCECPDRQYHRGKEVSHAFHLVGIAPVLVAILCYGVERVVQDSEFTVPSLMLQACVDPHSLGLHNHRRP